jgi:curved DNA-binding protein CbpA
MRRYSTKVPKALTHYQVLQVPTSSTTKEIKSAFRKLSKQFHPDMNQGWNTKQTKEKYIQIVHSYETLSDENKRREYDKSIHIHARPDFMAPGKVYSPGGINITRNRVHYGASYQKCDSPYADLYTKDVPHFDYDSHLKGNLWFEKRMINKRIHQRRRKTTSAAQNGKRGENDSEKWFQERFKNDGGLHNDMNEILNLHRYGHHQYREQASYDFKIGAVMAVMIGVTVLGLGVYVH